MSVILKERLSALRSIPIKSGFEERPAGLEGKPKVFSVNSAAVVRKGFSLFDDIKLIFYPYRPVCFNGQDGALFCLTDPAMLDLH